MTGTRYGNKVRLGQSHAVKSPIDAQSVVDFTSSREHHGDIRAERDDQSLRSEGERAGRLPIAPRHALVSSSATRSSPGRLEISSEKRSQGISFARQIDSIKGSTYPVRNNTG